MALTAQEKRNLLTQNFTPEEVKQLEIQNDPVLWAETYLMDPDSPGEHLKLRWYQKKMLLCNNKKKVYRCGRRIGKTIILAVEALKEAFIKEGVRVLICTPYKSQTALIWKDGFQKLIKGNEFLESSVSKMGQNPYLVELKNGSRIMGLTAGSSTGNKGGSIRGQGADILFLDEIDYMGQSAIQSIIAIAATKRGTRVIVSSTPTGKREFFYDVCTNKKLGFEEFYFPASVSPEWLSIEDCEKKGLPMHESQEYVFRNTYGEYEYEHEYMAKFGEETQGVFKHKFIDSSLITYNPNKEEVDNKGFRWFCGDEQKKENIYAMGVDWNGTKVGTQLVIVEYCRKETEIDYMVENEQGKQVKDKFTAVRKYRLFYRESISVENMTQLVSIRRIIELNKKFKIDHIYVDAGFGTTNIEELKLYGMRNQESGIKDKLVAIDFASTVTVNDPFSKEQIEKPLKPFTVNNAVQRLELGELILPDSEDEKVKLVGQIREYRIEKISPLGVPRYSTDNDHILVAFMLALLAYQMEYSELIKLVYTDVIGISKKPSMLMPGLDQVQDRVNSLRKNKLEELGVTQRQPMLNADHYHTDPRGRHMDYEDLVKTPNPSASPFTGVPIRTGWKKIDAPSRTSF